MGAAKPGARAFSRILVIRPVRNSIHGTMSETIPSITTAHELTSDTLRRLWDEVRGFWQGRDMTRSTSSFTNGGAS